MYRATAPMVSAGLTYERVRPVATYAPWRSDPEFQATLDVVRAHTLVDEYRLFELWSLVRNAGDRGGDILEVGVWRGGSGAVLARAAKVAQTGSRVFLCDTFEGVVKASDSDSTYRGGEHATPRSSVDELLGRLELNDVIVLQGVFPDDTASALGDVELGLCHIDVDVYESASSIFQWAWPRLRRGGVVVFDDYGFHMCDGVTRFVDEVAREPDRMFVHNLNGHGLLIKTK